MVSPLRRVLRRSGRIPEDVIELAAAALGRPPRILDFGVGFGRLAIPRILVGHDIYGVDIDEEALARGQRALAEAGLDPARFRLLRDGRSNFPDGHFDVIYSEDVLEHVGDRELEAFVTEVRRLTSDAGCGLHLYPGRYRPVEGHLHMPLLQWLPRNSLARGAIWAFTVLGIEAGSDFPGIAPGQGTRERTAIYYRWLLANTIYRPRADVERLFRAAGFRTTSPRSRFMSVLTHEYILTRLPSAQESRRHPYVVPGRTVGL